MRFKVVNLMILWFDKIVTYGNNVIKNIKYLENLSNLIKPIINIIRSIKSNYKILKF